ncbi:MAG: hypothetical protein IJO38_03885 [Akkermansia sp.]|nr:hypothetical protein [Akkermansia sp.]
MKLFSFSALCLTVPAVWAAPAAELPAAVQQAFDTYTALPGKLVPLLQKAQDTETATQAAPQLKAALPAIYEARELLHNMPRLTPTQNQLVRTRYGRRMREEWAGMYEQISRLKAERCYQSAGFAEVFHLMCLMIER